jgi:dihydroorotase
MSRTFDLIVGGGQLLDPATNREGRFDLGISGGRVTAVERSLPAQSSAQYLDVKGQLVVPGLVDLHTHLYEGSTYWGIDPDPIAWRTGVTTWVDAGSAGAYNLRGFRRRTQDMKVRTWAFLNISAVGLVGETGEARDISLCDPLLTTAAARQYSDLVVGVKCRIDSSTVGSNGIESLRRARAAATAAGVPLMVHIGEGPPLLEEVLELLRPGDILTHCATPHSMRLIDQHAHLRDGVRRAVDEGLLLDVGHGMGSFSFEVAETLIAQDCQPHVISTDLHALNVDGPVGDLPTCLSKFLALGMPLRSIIQAVTTTPARAIGIDALVGSLAIGRAADIAVFRIEEGSFRLYDVNNDSRDVPRMFRNTLTLYEGVPLPAREADPPPLWSSSPASSQVSELAT